MKRITGNRTQPLSVISVEAEVLWRVFQDPDSKFYIGICDELKITLQAKTFGELAECIEESLSALFEDLIETRELELFLREHGWRLQSPLPKRTENVRFDVPFTIERRRMHDFQGAVC